MRRSSTQERLEARTLLRRAWCVPVRYATAGGPQAGVLVLFSCQATWSLRANEECLVDEVAGRLSEDLGA